MEKNKPNPSVLQPSKSEIDVIEIINFVSANKLDKDSRIKALLVSLSHDPSNEERKAQLLRMIKPHIIHTVMSDDPFRPHPQGDEVDGEIQLGMCAETCAVFGLNPQELMQGTLVVGRPGAGKTTLTYSLIEGANKLGIHCLILDIKKDYRHLIRKLPNTLVFRADDPAFRWNPLQMPEGVKKVDHISRFADITSEAFYVQDGTNSYLVQHLNRLYQQYPQPTLADLHRAVMADKPPLSSREARFKESAHNRLGSIMVKMGNNFRYRTGYKLEKLLDSYNIIVEIDNIGDKGRIYLASLILSHVFQYRIENNLRGIAQRPALVIMDEGNEIFNKKLEEEMRGLTLVSMARQAREFQLGIVCSCQLPNAISDTVKNVYTRVLLNLPEGGNLRVMRQSMGLDEDQEKANYSLKTGQAIVRLAEKYDKPFLVQFNDYPITKDVSNDEVQRHMEPLLASIPLEPEQEPVEDKKDVLSNLEIKMLLSTYNEPFLKMTDRYKKLKVSSISVGDAIRDKLVKEKKLCTTKEIPQGNRGRISTYLVLTDAGFAEVTRITSFPKNYKIDESNFEHSFWEDRLSQHFKDYNPKIEAKPTGRKIDVLLKKEGNLFALEVAMTADYEKENIEKDIEAGCQKVIIGCKNKKVLEDVNAIIKGLGDEEKKKKVKALLLTEIIKLPPEKVLA